MGIHIPEVNFKYLYLHTWGLLKQFLLIFMWLYMTVNNLMIYLFNNKEDNIYYR